MALRESLRGVDKVVIAYFAAGIADALKKFQRGERFNARDKVFLERGSVFFRRAQRGLKAAEETLNEIHGLYTKILQRESKRKKIRYEMEDLKSFLCYVEFRRILWGASQDEMVYGQELASFFNLLAKIKTNRGSFRELSSLEILYFQKMTTFFSELSKKCLSILAVNPYAAEDARWNIIAE